MDERARALIRRISDLQNEMAEAEAELVEALHPTTATRTRQSRAASGGNGNGAGDMSSRGDLTEALRKVIQVQRNDWTRQFVIEKAGVPAGRENSANAAISRMLKNGEIEPGTATGTYRATKKEVQR